MPVMLLVLFIDLLGFGLIIPLLPFYGRTFSPDNPWPITMLMATYSGLQLVAAPFWGRMSDRLGRRPMMLLSLVTSIGSYVWMSQASALWMLFGARAIQGFSAGNIGVAQAYVADVTTPKERARAMALLGGAIGAGFTLGPWIGGYLAGADPNNPDVVLPALAAAGASALALLLAALSLKESLSPALRAAAAGGPQPTRLSLIADAFSRPRLRQVMILFFTSTFAFAGMEATFALAAYERFGWGPEAVGAIFFGIGIVLVLVQSGLVRRMMPRYGEAKLLLVGTILNGLGLLGLAVTQSPVFATVYALLLAAGQAFTSPTTTALVSRQAASIEQGALLGVNQSVGSLARLLGPAVAGGALAFAGSRAPFALGAAVMVIATWLSIRLVRDIGAEPAVARLEPGLLETSAAGER